MAARGPLLAVLSSTFCCMGLAHGAAAAALYSRLGDAGGVHALIREAVDHAVADEAARKPLADHICALAGGNCRSPRAPRISEAQFVELVEGLRASMRAHDVPLAARNELLEALAPLRSGP